MYQGLYQNIFVILKLIAALPVTSCECERSASVLRRLNNYMRASMGKGRLSNLAMLHIHYDKEISMDDVIDRYCRLHPRRIEMDTDKLLIG